MGELYSEHLRNWLRGKTPGRRIFSESAPTMLTTYRRINPKMEARSVRRGSLQALADTDVSFETLMWFSGHATLQTLMRYLNCGRKAAGQRRQMATAGKHLLPPSFLLQC